MILEYLPMSYHFNVNRLVPEVQAVLEAALRYCVSYDCMGEDIHEQVKDKKVPQ